MVEREREREEREREERERGREREGGKKGGEGKGEGGSERGKERERDANIIPVRNCCSTINVSTIPITACGNEGSLLTRNTKTTPHTVNRVPNTCRIITTKHYVTVQIHIRTLCNIACTHSCSLILVQLYCAGLTL